MAAEEVTYGDTKDEIPILDNCGDNRIVDRGLRRKYWIFHRHRCNDCRSISSDNPSKPGFNRVPNPISGIDSDEKTTTHTISRIYPNEHPQAYKCPDTLSNVHPCACHYSVRRTCCQSETMGKHLVDLNLTNSSVAQDIFGVLIECSIGC
jgi:hypothetical protein